MVLIPLLFFLLLGMVEAALEFIENDGFPSEVAVEVDLTNKVRLTADELRELVTRIRSAEDRYAQWTIRAHREVCSQIRLLTRWADRKDPLTGLRDEGRDIVTLVEV